MTRLLTLFANAYLIAFVMDTVLSVANTGLAILGVQGLDGVQSAVALAVLAASGPMLMLAAASPALPFRILAIPALFPLVVTILAPIPTLLVFGVDLTPLAAAPATLLQLVVAGAALRAIRRLGGGWLLRASDEPAFAWRRAAAAILCVGLALPLALAVAFTAEVVIGIDIASSGFLRLTLRGVEVAQHDWVRDGQTVRLVGMVHFGDRSFYRELKRDLNVAGSIVLEEGVTDPDDRLQGRLDYRKLAAKLGLYAQRPLPRGSPRTDRRNADLSMSDFSPSTVELLGAIGDLYAGRGNVAANIATVRALATPDGTAALLADIFDKRNAHLIAEIDDALDTANFVVVPWGAAHMPVLEDALRSRGFELGGWRTRVLMAW